MGMPGTDPGIHHFASDGLPYPDQRFLAVRALKGQQPGNDMEAIYCYCHARLSTVFSYVAPGTVMFHLTFQL